MARRRGGMHGLPIVPWATPLLTYGTQPALLTTKIGDNGHVTTVRLRTASGIGVRHARKRVCDGKTPGPQQQGEITTSPPITAIWGLNWRAIRSKLWYNS